MSQKEPLIRNISDTARWAAVYRARESARPDGCRNPTARKARAPGLVPASWRNKEWLCDLSLRANEFCFPLLQSVGYSVLITSQYYLAPYANSSIMSANRVHEIRLRFVRLRPYQ